MKCYLIRNDFPDRLDECDEIQLQSLTEKLEDIAKGEANTIKSIKVYSDAKYSSVDIFCLLEKVFCNNGVQISNYCADEYLNDMVADRSLLKYYDEEEINEEFYERIYEKLSTIVLDKDDTIIFLIVGENVIKAFQTIPEIHSFMYFGDETIENANDNYNSKKYESKKCIKSLDVVDVILEKPEKSKRIGIVYPVYAKYSQKKLSEGNKEF